MQNKIPTIILESPKTLDWIAGGETGVQSSRKVPSWLTFLSPAESQKTKNVDTSECVIFSASHSIASQVNYDIIKGNYSMEAIDFFHAAGFMQGGSFNVSEIFNAKCAGTTQQGTYMSAMGASYRHDGLLPQVDLPMPENMTWEDYDAIVITEAMRTKAKQALQYILPSYQWITGPVTPEHVALAPVQIAVGICPGWFTDKLVKACPAPMVHCVELYDLAEGKSIQDTYEPYLKTLASDYKIYAAMQYIATPRMPEHSVPKPVWQFNVDVKQGSPLTKEISMVQTFLAWNGLLDQKYICGSFGPRTTQAVNDFQDKYEYDILLPAGVAAPTGKWGSFTRKKANALLTN